MHHSSSCIIVPGGIAESWGVRWIELVSARTALDPDACARIRHFVDFAVRAHTLPLSPLDIIGAARKALAPTSTGLSVEITQRLGTQALADVLVEQSSSITEAYAIWQTLALPWLYHPYFTVAALQPLATQTDQSSILATLSAELRATVPAEALRIWRYVGEDSPLVEITGHEALLSPDEDDAFLCMLRSPSPSITDDRLLVPLQDHKRPFAIIEVRLSPDSSATTTLQVLTLCHIAEQALGYANGQEQSTSAATWQRVLTSLSQMLTVTHSADDILTAMAEQIRQALPCERIGYWEYDAEAEAFDLRMLSARLTAQHVPVGTRCPAADTPLHVAWFTGQPLLLDANWPHRFPAFPNATSSINAIAVIPLVFEYSSLGILTVERLELRPFTRQDADWLMLVGGMVGAALRNISIHQELRNAQQRMLEDAKMRALGEMAAGIAHDFNNILMTLICNVELMGMATALPQVQERLPRLERAIMDARTMVQRVSNFGRIDTRGDFSPVCLAEILHDTAELLRPQLQTKCIAIHTAFDDTAWAQGNASELREVVTNFITNAMYAMPQGGTLTLACGRTEDTSWLQVTDSGQGMSPAVLARACEPFFSTKGGMGTGLGLSVSYRIIHRHHGELHLESQEGQGTTAHVALPACAPPGRVAVAAVTAPAGRHILIVEDNAEIADLLGQLLDRLGYRTTLADAPPAAIACCEQQRFDLVITDLAMQGETGDTVAQAVRQLQPNTPVLLLSGSLDLEAGSDHLYVGLLHKPITLEALHTAIDEALTRAGTAVCSV